MRRYSNFRNLSMYKWARQLTPCLRRAIIMGRVARNYNLSPQNGRMALSLLIE